MYFGCKVNFILSKTWKSFDKSALIYKNGDYRLQSQKTI